MGYYNILFCYSITAVLIATAVVVMAEVMRDPGMTVDGTMAGDMGITTIDTEVATDMVHITGMIGRESYNSFKLWCLDYLSASSKNSSLKIQ